jgi:uncharacterized protein (DUF2147 family)
MVFALVAAAATAVKADIKTEEKNQAKFEGMMGRMMGLFGGKAAREGTIDTVAVKGNRKMTAGEYTGEIIDLDEQKVYTLDMRKKTYEVVTFEEMRRRLQEAQEKAAKAAKEQPRQEAAPESGQQPQMEIDFSLKDSGQKRNINGFDCHEVVMTITARQKGKTLEEAGGYVTTSHIWLGPMIPGMKEIAEFDQRYYKEMSGSAGLPGSAEQMAMVTAMYPGMKEMMGKMESENVKMDGTPILTETIMETVRSPEQAAQESKREGESSGGVTSIRGIGGMLGRKMARKKADEGGPKTRSTIMTFNHELLKVLPAVAASDVSIPAGFKEKK